MPTRFARGPSPRTDTFVIGLTGQRARVSSLISGTYSTIRKWIARSRQRRALREIAECNDHHLLKDMGISQGEAFREADKPFWRR